MAMTGWGASIRALFAWMVVAACFTASVAMAQRPAQVDIEQDLQRGGYVLVIGNGQSHAEAPAEGERATSNFDGEIELDEHGQGQMLVISYAFRTLQMHVDQTLSAPAFRSRQSATYLGFGEETVTAEAADSAWLAQRVRQAPTEGRNTVIVTDKSLIAKAFPREGRNLGDAETLIFRPSEGGADFVTRLTTADWAKLAVH